MSFGWRDEEWIYPPEDDGFDGSCDECARFEPCPCGCGWGICRDDPCAMFFGGDGGCGNGEPL